MGRFLFGKFHGAGILSRDRCDTELDCSFKAVGAAGFEPFTAGEQTGKPRGIREQRPNFRGRSVQAGCARMLHAPPRAASTARAIARLEKTRAISARYSPEAWRSESGSIPCAALREASSINLSEIVLPASA